MSFPIHAQSFRRPPTSGNFLVFGDSISDFHTSISVDPQAQWVTSLAATYGWTVVGKGTGGTGAKLTAGVSGGAINAVTIVAGGTGYTAPGGNNTAVAIGGPGTGGVITPTVAGGVITGNTIATPGTGYTTAPLLNVSDYSDGTRAAIGGNTLQGYQTNGGILTIATRVTAYSPVVVGIFFGTNDVNIHGLTNNGVTGSVANFLANYGTLIATLQAFAAKPYLFAIGLFPWLWPGTAVTPQYDRAIAQACRDAGVPYISMSGLTAALHTTDGIHPNTAGQAAMATIIPQAINAT